MQIRISPTWHWQAWASSKQTSLPLSNNYYGFFRCIACISAHQRMLYTCYGAHTSLLRQTCEYTNTAAVVDAAACPRNPLTCSNNLMLMHLVVGVAKCILPKLHDSFVSPPECKRHARASKSHSKYLNWKGNRLPYRVWILLVCLYFMSKIKNRVDKPNGKHQY